MSRFVILDVFTDQAFGGNPLAVVLDAPDVAEDRLQKIAREFNFSETTFVYPPEDPSHTARVRIFTPSAELPFAGHPTVGTAVVLAGKGHGSTLTLELGVGPITVSVEGQSARFTTTVPLTRGTRPVISEIAACLGLPVSEIRSDRHAPEMADVGLSFCFVELTGPGALADAAPDLAAFRRAADRYRDRRNFGIFCYARDEAVVRARMFAPTGGIPEDPATGSASAALTALIATLEERSTALTIHQGVEMGRPSLIRTEAIFGDGGITETSVAGDAVPVAEGRLLLP